MYGLQDITRIWSSFHFLPYNLNADIGRSTRLYRNKYRLICKPNGKLISDTIAQAKGKGTQAVGIAMHILADTWAHSGFAGTPSLVINNTNPYFYELLPDIDGFTERPVRFRHNPGAADDPEKGYYTNSIYQGSETSIMNLGHGRAGHLPDYSFIRYKYLPAWGNYAEIIKDNPSDYYHAFCQMIYAMKYLRGEFSVFETGTYDTEAVSPEDFDLEKYQAEYLGSAEEEKDKTFLGVFFIAAMAQKSMVTNKIYKSGSLLAGFSTDYDEKGFRGIRDYRKLIGQHKEEKQ